MNARLGAMLLGTLLAFPYPAFAQSIPALNMGLGRGVIKSARSLTLTKAPEPKSSADRIVVIGIDKQTEQALGEFGPGYRPYNTRLIKRLNEAGIRGAAFDIYFPEYPEWKRDTEKLAEAAAGGAPIVVSVYAELRPNGAFAEKPNDTSIRDNPAVGQGSINFAYETVTAGETSTDGPVVVVADAAGYPSLVVELLRRVGVVRKGELRRKGFVGKMMTGFNGKPLALEVMQPRLGEVQDGDITIVSFLEVLGGAHQETLKGALVLVGVTDMERDVFENPDPAGAPQIAKLPGVYIHAAMMRRILSAAKEDAGPARRTPLAPGSPVQGLVGSIDKAYSSAERAKTARIKAQAGGEQEAMAFLSAMDGLVTALEGVEAGMNEKVFSGESDSWSEAEKKALKESFTALYSIVPLPPDYQNIEFPPEASQTFDRYHGLLDALANLTAFSLDVGL